MTDHTNSTNSTTPFAYLAAATEAPADAAAFALDLLAFLRCAEQRIEPDFIEDEPRLKQARQWLLGMVEEAVSEIARHERDRRGRGGAE